MINIKIDDTLEDTVIQIGKDIQQVANQSLTSLSVQHNTAQNKLEISANNLTVSIDTLPMQNAKGEIVGYAIDPKSDNGMTDKVSTTSDYRLVWKENNSTNLTVNNFTGYESVIWDIVDSNGNSITDNSLDNEYKITYSTVNPDMTMLEVSKTGSFHYRELSNPSHTLTLQNLTNRSIDVSAYNSSSGSFGITIECLSDKVIGSLEVIFNKV